MSIEDVKVPDIGDFKNVPVIEILVKPGDTVKAEDAIVTLESDKATMDVPSPAAGKVVEVLIKLGDKVSEGTPILKLESGAAAGAAPSPAPAASAPASAAPAAAAATPRAATPAPQQDLSKGPGDATDAPLVKGRAIPPPMDFGDAHASPSVRRLARELEVDLKRVTGTGEKGRITKDDVKRAVAGKAAAAPAGSGFGIPEIPAQDFSKFGAIETQPLSRIKKISGANLARNWAMIPHVTQFEDADITEMEAFRKKLGEENKETKVTPLVFLIKAAVASLRKFPSFNASLDEAGENLVLKRYFHVGIAVDTPNGLVVPVIRDCDQKGLLQLAAELGEISKKARDGKLGPADMSGGCFSISSLGGIGGTSFTPIINAPEVAILGVSKSSMKPVWNGKEFAPRLMLPLSLSYDHRVIDGAEAARFAGFFAQQLSDIRRLLL